MVECFLGFILALSQLVNELDSIELEVSLQANYGTARQRSRLGRYHYQQPEQRRLSYYLKRDRL